MNTGEANLPGPRVSLEYQLPEGRESDIFTFDGSDCEYRATLATGESCEVEVTFRPIYPGPRSGTLILTDPSGQAQPVTATFKGVGNGPIVSLSPSHLFLGSYLIGNGQAPPSVLTMANIGNADLAISALSLENLGTNPNQVMIVGGTCAVGSTVAPKGFCTIQVAFEPTQEGEFTAGLRIADNAAHGFQEVGIRGQGVAGSSEAPTARVVRIKKRPPSRTMRRTAIFQFAVRGGGVSFVCRLDRGPFRPCRSPMTYRRLALGTHVFRVKPRVHVAGVWDGAAAARFRILPKGNAK